MSLTVYVCHVKNANEMITIFTDYKDAERLAEKGSVFLEMQPGDLQIILEGLEAKRQRYYWTNIPGVELPADKGIKVQDILQPNHEVDPKYIITGKFHEWFEKNYLEYIKKSFVQLDDEKAIPHIARSYANWKGNFTRTELIVPEATKKGFAEIKEGESFDFRLPNSKTRRGRRMAEKSNSIVSQDSSFCLFQEGQIRRYTPIEIERLQTVPDNYTNHVSDSQRYKMLGNGFTVDVIAHILGYLPSSIIQ